MHREYVTGRRRTKPKRPYQNFQTFCHAHGSDFGNRYPCLVCRGQGRIDHPADPPDPVEGYRNVRQIPCPECQGSSKGTKEACRQAYQEALEAYRKEKADFDRLIRLRKAALGRLIPEEIQALRELGL